jgi:hypothetical protein
MNKVLQSFLALRTNHLKTIRRLLIVTICLVVAIGAAYAFSSNIIQYNVRVHQVRLTLITTPLTDVNNGDSDTNFAVVSTAHTIHPMFKIWIINTTSTGGNLPNSGCCIDPHAFSINVNNTIVNTNISNDGNFAEYPTVGPFTCNQGTVFNYTVVYGANGVTINDGTIYTVQVSLA